MRPYWVILLGTVLTAVFATVLLVRVPTVFQSSAKEVRGEPRAGREEAGAAAMALPEKSATGLKLGMGSLSDTLTALGVAQEMHREGMTTSYSDVGLRVWSGGTPRFRSLSHSPPAPDV